MDPLGIGRATAFHCLDALGIVVTGITIDDMSEPSFSVVDLRDRPEFASTVADRVWRGWWEPKGHELAPIEAFSQSCLGNDPIPSAVVAHDGAMFLGSALIITSDLDERPR